MIGVVSEGLTGQRPIEPIPTGGTNTAADALNSLPSQGAFVSVRYLDELKNEVSYGTSAVTQRNGKYSLITDYVLFENVPVTIERISKNTSDTDGEEDVTSSSSTTYCALVYRVGIGIRIKADFVALRGGLRISSLSDLAAAAQKHALSGTLWSESLGLTGPKVSTILVQPCQITGLGVQNALRSIDATKELLDEPPKGLRVQPHIISLNPDWMTVQEALFQILGGPDTSEERQQGTPPRAVQPVE